VGCEWFQMARGAGKVVGTAVCAQAGKGPDYFEIFRLLLFVGGADGVVFAIG
jgi:hypothetical protein